MLGSDSCPLKPSTRASRGLKDQPGSPAPGGSLLLSENRSDLSLRLSNDGLPFIRTLMVSVLSTMRLFSRKAQTSRSTVCGFTSLLLLDLGTGKGRFLRRVTVAFFHGISLRKVNFYVHVMKELLYVEKSFLSL